MGGGSAMFVKKFCLPEALVIVLIAGFFLRIPYLGGFLYVLPDFFSYAWTTTKTERFDWRNSPAEFLSFLESNLDIGYNDKELFSDKMDLCYKGMYEPISISKDEKKPYYLFNSDRYFPAYSLRFFRRFTLGDGTPEFAERHKDIKAVIFYQRDFDKLKDIKRKVKKIVLQDDRYKIYAGNCIVANGIWRTYRTKSAEDLKFIAADSSKPDQYDIISPDDYRGNVHYLEGPKTDGHFSAHYSFLLKDVIVNPILPLEAACDIKANYSGAAIAGEIGIYAEDSKTLVGNTAIGPGGSHPAQEVWVRLATGISPPLRKIGFKPKENYIYKLEKIVINADFTRQLLGIMFFDD